MRPHSLLRGGLAWCAALLVISLPGQSLAQPAGAAARDDAVIEAREALRKGDRTRLASLRQQLVQAGHPLAGWADYWELTSRLPQATVDEVERFYQRWPGSYVEDRLRNDWLLELGRRRDWAAFSRDLPRFRMNDDREVRCYAQLIESQAGRGDLAAALAAWHAQREAEDGCQLLATHLRDSGQIGAAELWFRLRLAVETGRQRSARAAAQLISAETAQAVDLLWDNPARFLTRAPGAARAQQGPLAVLAVMRLAASDPAVAAQELDAPWARALKPEWAAAAWGLVARQGTLRQLPEATGWADTALRLEGQVKGAHGLSDDVLGWLVRAQLRATARQPEAWASVVGAIDAMSEAEQAESTWSYWRARALLARARPGSGGEAALAEARSLLQRIASPLHFYGQLAQEELGQKLVLPAEPEALLPAEREAARQHAGLQRALRMMGIGLRSEGVREWNFSLIGMDDRQVLASAQLACEAQIWDRCINTSDRTRTQIDLTQRYPLPFHDEILGAAGQAKLDPALVLGLIRQESRFVIQARSPVGASGLMQVMPPTARWTARRIGLDLKGDWRDDRVTNLRLGTAYLQMVLDDFGGSLPMALAAYNAGPNRPRRWREGAILEPAIWAETIPIHETRDYVKKVLANTAVYARRLGAAELPSTRSLLGAAIGPREPDAPEPNKELP